MKNATNNAPAQALRIFLKKINIWQHLHIFDMNLVVSQSWMISRFSLALISFKFAKSILV